jgi:type I restriction enzyme S subunit
MISFAETKQKWQTKKLGEVCLKITDGSHNPPKGLNFSEYLMLSSKNVFDDCLTFDSPRYLSQDDFQLENKRTDIMAGDVLLTIVGTIGRVAVVPNDSQRFTLQRSVAVLKHNPDVIDSRFLMRLLQSIFELISNEARGVAQKGFYLKQLRDFEISFPTSLTEQRRIVSILDEAFSEIDEAKVITEKNLENARQLFESYLDEIFTNHRSDWKKNNLKSLTTKIGSGATPLGGEKAYKSSGISLIRSLNVYDYEFRLKNLAFIDDEQAGKLDNVIVMEDDVLLNITGASVARCFLVPFNILPARVNQHVSIIRCSKDQILPEFLHYLLISKPYKDLLLNTGEKGGATRQALTKNQIENFVIKYPILDEQIDIIGKLDKLLKESTKLKILYNQKLIHLEELKKSILKQAFEGKL